ncbi:FG-GAP repeat domain-containing protein [Streptomyces bobili]|uniref:FG-GAP repeat domain-containing protein n=1 Tax=Streptomyces bobili TaxID=67280 RepID=UPI0036FF0178
MAEESPGPDVCSAGGSRRKADDGVGVLGGGRFTWGDWSRTDVHAGDFNGDGKDDIATWCDYADGSDKIHTYVSLSTGTFAAPKQAWSLPAGTITYQVMHMVPANYNGDGLDDLAPP